MTQKIFQKFYLGIETSCDETAAAVVCIENGTPNVLSNVIATQLENHAPFGGVVPEIAARAHIDKISEVVKLALSGANKKLAEIDAIAVTSGPGLIGGVMVGVLFAKALAIGANKPFIGINHLEGHALSPKLNGKLEFPYLLLLISGGHCQILLVKSLGVYMRLGSTIDDALGEAFDKVSKMLGLGYPGGPKIEQMAKKGNGKRFEFPKPLINREGCDFSFAGLKTAVLRQIEKIKSENGDLSENDIADICASFQNCVCDVLLNRLENGLMMARVITEIKDIVVAGGVAANQQIRSTIENFCAVNECQFHAPELKYCGDNGAMIALAGGLRILEGQISSLDLKPRPRWPLDELSNPMALKHGFGKKGAKA